jgi:hypothetical protein
MCEAFLLYSIALMHKVDEACRLDAGRYKPHKLSHVEIDLHIMFMSSLWMNF